MLRKQVEARPSAVSGTTTVTFVLPGGLWASRVHLVGDFNGWNERSSPMEHTPDGWAITLCLPAGRSFQYRYLVDGTTWINDWAADHYLPNSLGGHNSVVTT